MRKQQHGNLLYKPEPQVSEVRSDPSPDVSFYGPGVRDDGKLRSVLVFSPTAPAEPSLLPAILLEHAAFSKKNFLKKYSPTDELPEKSG